MLDKYLNRKEIISFIDELENNNIFCSLSAYENSNYGKYIGSELALYTFYDALMKYKIIIDDDNLFDDFFEQVQKIYRRITTYDDLVLGIKKVICNIVGIKIGVKNFHSSESKNAIITYIYNKYILEGYYYHGFSTIYEDTIKENGFIPDSYENFYSLVKKVDKIFSKYGVSNIMGRDFDNGKIYFTDDFIMGCYYSVVSPNYFYNLLCNQEIYGKRIRKDSYLIGDYSTCIKNLKRYMSNNLFSEKDKNFILKLVDDMWSYLHKVDRKISVLVVKRRLLDGDVKTNVDDFLNDDCDLYETIDRIFSSKYSNVSVNKIINSSSLEVISLDDFYRNKIINKEGKSNSIISNFSFNFNNESLNAYGRASIFIILGSMMITLGVIITIISILRGY